MPCLSPILANIQFYKRVCQHIYLILRKKIQIDSILGQNREASNGLAVASAKLIQVDFSVGHTPKRVSFVIDANRTNGIRKIELSQRSGHATNRLV